MAVKRAPFVAMRTDVSKDVRFAVLGDVCGYNRYEAVGRIFELWSWCTDRKLMDAPPDCRGYAVPEAVARRFLGPHAVAGLLGDGCDDLALAELRPDGLLYLRGTEESVSRQRGLQVTAVAGGEARHATGSRVAGQFVSDDTCDRVDSHPHVAGESVLETTIIQPCTSREPAVSQPPTSRDSSRNQRDPTVHSPQTTDPESEIPVKAKRALMLAPGWAPARGKATESAERTATERGVDLRLELAKLHDWALSHGVKRSDWDAVWRNWTRNAKPTDSRRAGQRPTLLQTLFTDIDELQRQEDLEKAGAS